VATAAIVAATNPAITGILDVPAIRSTAQWKYTNGLGG
jgi:hypothetical protein